MTTSEKQRVSIEATNLRLRIAREDVLADYYDLPRFTRAAEDITLFKNGGGAHLDLMTARYILDVWKAPAG